MNTWIVGPSPCQTELHAARSNGAAPPIIWNRQQNSLQLYAQLVHAFQIKTCLILFYTYIAKVIVPVFYDDTKCTGAISKRQNYAIDFSRKNQSLYTCQPWTWTCEFWSIHCYSLAGVILWLGNLVARNEAQSTQAENQNANVLQTYPPRQHCRTRKQSIDQKKVRRLLFGISGKEPGSVRSLLVYPGSIW